MNATKRDLVGRKIVDVNFRRFRTGRSERPWSTDPLLTLDDGRTVWFVTAETEIGEYGVEISVSERVKRANDPR